MSQQQNEIREKLGITYAIVLRDTGLGPAALTAEEALSRYQQLPTPDQARVRYLAAQFIASRATQFPPQLVEVAGGILRKAGTAEAYQAMTVTQPDPSLFDLTGQFFQEAGREAAGMVLPGGALWKLAAIAVVVAVAAYVLPGSIAKAVAGKN